jgi:nitroreductase
MINRRKLLLGLGSIAAVGVGGTTWRAADQGVFSTGSGAAYVAWDEWNPPGDDVIHLARAAVLAASAHNAQPWLFRLSPDRIELTPDLSRNLGAMDPLNREMQISVGCALENLTLAARHRGRAPEVLLRPDGATILLGRSTPETSPLFEAIPRRHTNRAAYDARPMETQQLAGLVDVPEVSLVWHDKAKFSELTVRATEAIIADADQSRDDFAWYRGDWDDLQEAKDGITIDASGQSQMIRTMGKILPSSHDLNNDTWLESTRDTQLPTAAAVGSLLVHDPLDPVQRMQTGRIWQRMHLWATTQGLAMQPINQIEERVDRERSANLKPDFTDAMAALVPAGGHAIFSFRIGYPTTTALASPRRPAEEVSSRGA